MADQQAETGSPTSTTTLHGTVIALRGLSDGEGRDTGTVGVMIRGASGMGKSDLALRCLGLSPPDWLSCRCFLVADDYVAAAVSATGQLVVRSLRPDMAGLLEVRGVGLIRAPVVCPPDVPATAGRGKASAGEVGGGVAVGLVVDLVEAGTSIARLPDIGDADSSCEVLGVRIARLRLHPFEASAPLKVLLAAGRRTQIAHASCT